MRGKSAMSRAVSVSRGGVCIWLWACHGRERALQKTRVIDYIQKGGLLMWPILGCSIIAIAVFAERLFYLHRATIHVGEFLKGLSNLIRHRNFAEALHESAGTPGPVARVIHAAIIRHDAPREIGRA